MEDCIFCKIARKEIPSTTVYETDSVIAFDDLNPQAPVHTLVIPKDHYMSVSDNVPAPLMAELFQAAHKVAEIKGVDKTGYRLITNNGSDAGQTVFHFHIHVLGGKKLSEGLIP